MKHYIGLLLLSFLLFGCSKNEKKLSSLDKFGTKKSFALSTEGSSNVIDYYSFLANPANGIFGITANTTDLARPASFNTSGATAKPNATSLTITPVNIGGAFYDANSHIISGGTVSFGGITLNPNPGHGNYYGLENSSISNPTLANAISANGYLDYSTLAGTVIPVSINPIYGSSNLPNKGADGTMYVPQIIRLDKASMPFYSDGMGSSILSIYSKNNNTNIQWNADPNNGNGVVIIIEYDPTFKSNLDYWAPQSPPENRRLYCAVKVPDTGQYTFTPEDLQGLPSNCMAIMTIGRAQYVTFNDRDTYSQYSLYAATAVETLCRLSQCSSSITTPCPN